MIDNRDARMTIGSAIERSTAGDHLVEDHAQTEDVAARIDRFTLGLLR
jgi:hypothetical protein